VVLISAEPGIGKSRRVIGREFSYELIEQVAQRAAAELRLRLDRLVDAGLLFCRGAAPQSIYLFKHALIQDAAYGTLLRGIRRELHARAGTILVFHDGTHGLSPGTDGSYPSPSSGQSVSLPQPLSSVENPGFPRASHQS
jgi:hypothetical protein